MKRMTLAGIKEKLPILAVMFITSFIYIWKLWDEGLANLFYAAGVFSMGQNLHAFFYNSIDSVGFISIDKPPLGLWIQVLFTKVLGFGGMALLLPQALAGILSVFVLYRVVKQRFGQTAGITAALVLSFTPILVAVSRNNTMDGTLALILVLASAQAVKAAEKSSLKHLVFACIFVGLGFNIKMLQAFMIVPALFLTYFMFSNEKFWRKTLSCAISLVVLITISFSWVVAVDLTPAQNRPYVGSSGTNSALDLALGNNGIGRLLGLKYKSLIGTQPSSGSPGQLPPGGPSPQNIQPGGPAPQDNPVNRGNGGESGAPSLFRLFTVNNAGQISWFLLPALLVCVLSLFLVMRRKTRTDQKNVVRFYFAMCFLSMMAYFCFSPGLVHRYYLAMLAFPIAALTGIGVSFAAGIGKGKHVVLPLVFGLTAATQLVIQSIYPGWLDWLLPVSAAWFLIVSILLIVCRKSKSPIAALLLSSLLLLPGIWSLTPMIYGNNAQLPISGPELARPGDSFDKHPDLSRLVSFLKQNRDGKTYLATAPSAMSMGAELILQSGEPVMVLGGFNGGDHPITVEEFKKMIADGKVKYAVIPNLQPGNPPMGTNDASRNINGWIIKNGVVVKENFVGVTLYQLAISR